MNNRFSNRELLLIDYLRTKDYATSEEMANYLTVSKRTIKKDLDRLKKNINSVNEYLISTPSKGYYLNKSYCFEVEGRVLSRDKDLILNNYDRVAYLIQKLLLLGVPIRYEDLADELFISVSSLKQDMSKVRILLSEFKLKIHHIPRYGVKVTGHEFHFRVATATFFFQSFLSYLSGLKQSVYKRDASNIKYIENKIKDVCQKYEIKLTDSSINDLAIYVLISYERVCFEEKLSFLAEDCQSQDYQAATEIICETAQFFAGKKLGTASINFIYLHLTSKKVISDALLVDVSIDEVIVEMQTEIFRNFDLDFSQHQDIWYFIKMHIIQLRQRIKYDLTIQNPLVFQFFRDYLFAAKITLSAIQVLQEKLIKKPIAIDEFGFFILYFQAMLEQKSPVRKIFVYTGGNRAEQLFLSDFFKSNLNTKTNQITFIDSLPGEREKFDLLLSTGDIKLDYPEQTIVSNLNRSKLNGLQNMIERIDQKSTILNKYIDSNSLLILRSRTKKKIVQEMLGYLLEQGYLKDNHNPQLSFHEVGNSVVHIQDLWKIIRQRICLVVLLKHPILWEKTVVKTLFLIKTKKDGDKDLRTLCKAFSAWINNPDEIQMLHESPTVDRLYRQLEGG